MFAKSNQSERGRKNFVDSDCHSIATSKELNSAQTVATQTYSLLPKKQKELVQSIEMPMKMKGVLKGLRYISQKFDNGKEEEMQIGYPTDVKHVAHIGWAGPCSTPSPNWVNEYSNGDANKSNVKGTSLEDVHRTGAGIDGSRQDLSRLPKPSRRQPFLSTSSSVNSPRSDQPKQSKRHQSTANISTNSPLRDATKRSSKPSKQSQNAGLSIDSSSPDQTTDPKKSRRKSKGSSCGGSIRPSRSKAQSTPTSPIANAVSVSKGSSCGGSIRPSRSKAQSTPTSPIANAVSVRILNNEVCSASTLEPFHEGEKGKHGLS